MTLKSLQRNLSTEDREEWIDYARLMKTDDLKLYLNINQQMQEYEVCGILSKELEKRKEIQLED